MMKTHSPVRPKKHLGQHFLTDRQIAQDITGSIRVTPPDRKVIEVGPGMGVLTQHLLQLPVQLTVIEIDTESVAFLRSAYPELSILEDDFLKIDLSALLQGDGTVIGNFPYNISSQILFHCLDHWEDVTEIVGMFQKEVAERIAATHGNKTYGILSVLMQTWYDIEYLFTVHEHVFTPPPKVKSAVIRLRRKENISLPVSDMFFRRVVKTAFNQRRKTLRNALAPLFNGKKHEHEFLTKRAEQLSIAQFAELAAWLDSL